MSPRPEIAVDIHDGVALLTLDRPESRNPLGLTFSDAFQSALDEAVKTQSVGALVVTGRGSVFCGGGDLQAIMSPAPRPIETDYQVVRGFNRVIARIRGLDLAVIAAVNGPAIGGGAALALACDIAITSSAGRYDFAFERVGLSSADMGCAFMLARALGHPRASRILLTGASVEAAELLALGLVAEIVPADRLLSRALELGRRVAAGPRWANMSTKLALRRSESIDLEAALEYEAFLQAAILGSADHKHRLEMLLAQLAKPKN